MSNYVPPTTPIGMPPQQQFPRPPQKKSNTLTYVLVGCGTFVILGVIAVVAGGYFFYNKAKEVGLDAELMQKQPALAAAKIMVAMNPDIELVSVDEAKGLITIKDKKTGENVTINLTEARDGKDPFGKGDDDEVSLETEEGDEDSGSLEVKTKDGTAKFGSGAAAEGLPDWFPAYPDASVQGNYSAQGEGGYTGGYQFTTQDSIDSVVKFYEAGLTQAGLKVTTNLMRQDGKVTGGMASGEDAEKKRTAFINAAIGDYGTQVTVVVTSK